ncbi:hypothetical protein TI39_contig423g00012 [Zymoseptoria brevis]|uniref:Uncharacterized protein n=1 Tax=Zymoseptoria brevis TaxID=1047168 RepID=A0A0F4GLH9_9PEZI|nr:hypothetical protein TI39_contig423g00012 [Zymoseptoria brevis]
MTSYWHHPVGPGSFIVFQRLIRFYTTFLILTGLVSALSAGVLQLQEFHPTTTSLQRFAEGFFVSSTATAVIAAMLATMPLFRFEGYVQASRKDLCLAWSPLVILDWSILSFLAGLVTWYTDKNPDFRSSLVGPMTGVGLAFCLWVAVDMWFTIRRPGGLGKELEFINGMKTEGVQDDGGGSPKPVHAVGVGVESVTGEAAEAADVGNGSS